MKEEATHVAGEGARKPAQADARDLVVEVLLTMERRDGYLDRALAEVFAREDVISRQTRAFVERLGKGCVERRIELDDILDQFSDINVKKMKPVIRAILRSALYELRFLSAAPDAVIVSEAVRLAKKRGFSGLSGFVNGVLRAIVRHPERILYPSIDEEPIRALSVRYSMPEWIVARYLAAFGQERCERILAAYLAARPLCVRVDIRPENPSEGHAKIPAAGGDADPSDLPASRLAQVRASLEARGIRVTVDERLPYAFYLEGYDSLEEIPAFADGTLYPQDVASMLAVELADPRPGDVVLDVCAAPGGKSLHAASRVRVPEGSGGIVASRIGASAVSPAGHSGEATAPSVSRVGEVTARDLTEEKVKRIRENRARCHAFNVRAEVWDARLFDPRWEGAADLVIADLPCSGLGVIGHKPDIKYRVSEKEIAQLAALQREILAVAARYVRPGGTLLYATCTVTEEENAGNVRWFLARFSAFSLEREEQLLPDEGCDGFFMAKLTRAGGNGKTEDPTR